MKLKAFFLAATALLLPSAALAAPGIVTASIGMRAGPGPGFPMVDRIPDGSHVDIHGCLRGGAWCDVSWSGDRGWVSSEYLEYRYHDRYVYLPDYVSVIDVPIVPFALDSYWASYYSGRPWYHRRAYWDGYWRSHENLAYQGPGYRSGRAGTAETRAGVNEGRTRTGVTTGLAGREGAVNGRGEQGRIGREHGMQGRIGSEHGATRAENRAMGHQQQTIGLGHEGNRISAAPHANGAMHAPAAPPHVAQPSTVGRAGGAPTNAHAQMGGGHGPEMPHGGGGGAPAHIGGGAPHVGGGGGPAGGAPGHQKH